MGRTHASCLLLAAFALVAAVQACYVTNVGSATCAPANCDRLTGSWQNASGFWPQPKPAGGINYEFFQDLGPTGISNRAFRFLAQGPANNVSECCDLCSKTGLCQFFRYFPIGTKDNHQAVTNARGTYAFTYPTPYPTCNLGSGNCGTYNRNDGTKPCILFSLVTTIFEFRNGTSCAGAHIRGCYPDITGSGDGNVIGPNWLSGNEFNLILSNGTMNIAGDQKGRPRSYFGGSCNPYVNGSVVDDPHFVGGDGVRFDFNGQIGKSFCLLSDEKVHINMVMGGYLDERTYGATVLQNGKAIRSWITGLNVMWKDAQGQRQSLYLEARKGKQQERGQGFVASARLNGDAFSLDAAGDVKEGPGGVQVTLVAQGKRGPFDQDEYLVEIPGVLTGTVLARVAHPLLQTATEAFAHFNLRLDEFRPSPTVHGVLGQTLREDGTRVMKVLEYRILTSLLRAPIQADGASGEGYLEGQTNDYVTSAIDEPDCHYAVFA